MFSSREINPQLPKDVWLHFIIPFMDNEALIDFSAASKETRQLAFAELFKRPEFAYNIFHKIHASPKTNTHAYYQNLATWGSSDISQLLRFAQFGSIGLSISMLGILCERSLRNYPPCPADYLFSPQQIDTVLSAVTAGLMTASLLLRALFQEENKPMIDNYQHELDREAALKERSIRLKYLRDELPKQSVSTHSLFLKIYGTSSNDEELTQRFTIP